MLRAKLSRTAQYLMIAFVAVGCAVVAEQKLNELWGKEEVRDRSVSQTTQGIPEYHRDIQPIFDKRCVSCHACYDGPCQLKLTSYDGVDRGASSELVYDGTRLLAIEPSRLGVDEKNTQEWRERGYFPVLNERHQQPDANLYGSLLYRMLELKKNNPLPQTNQLDSDAFDFSTARVQECPTIAEYEGFASNHPQWGMPFGLPAISDEDFDTVKRWVEAGSPVIPLKPLGEKYQKEISLWETFFNGESNKEQLFSRYAFEHLYLGNLWFEALGSDQYFKLVRSRSPSGEPIDEIASRRPFDDPGVDQFYYRLKPVRSTIVDKTHMPYMLNDGRMERWRQWFLEPSYEVTNLPGYDVKLASNPFATFKDLPTQARYKFMLEEAEFTIMGYIKGPVCRGQVALNVIEDHFWVFFVDPDIETMLYDPAGAERAVRNLRLPAEQDSNASPFSVWTEYSELQEQHLKDKLAFINSLSKEGAELTLGALWNGQKLKESESQPNQNAALTIFRHFDNATVVKGLQGPKPKTAWVISYSLLERIHYLLVAGFDVFGNLGHQLNTRLYMDFLRMEGESNFLMLLPDDAAERELLSWYDGAEEKVESYLEVLRKSEIPNNTIEYSSDNPKAELFDKLIEYMGPQVLPEVPLLPPELIARTEGMQGDIAKLKAIAGPAVAQMPELSMVRVKFNDGQQHVFSMAVNRFHKNVSSLFLEEKRLKPEGFTLTTYPGVLGSYPNVFFDVHALLFEHFVERIQSLETAEDYTSLLDDFAVRRTDPKFWDYVDWLHVWYLVNQPLKAGIIDLNRFENR